MANFNYVTLDIILGLHLQKVRMQDASRVPSHLKKSLAREDEAVKRTRVVDMRNNPEKTVIRQREHGRHLDQASFPGSLFLIFSTPWPMAGGREGGRGIQVLQGLQGLF